MSRIHLTYVIALAALVAVLAFAGVSTPTIVIGLLILACPLMMMFMMGGHGGHSGDRDHRSHSPAGRDS